jgi:GAF domain-containing protein
MNAPFKLSFFSPPAWPADEHERQAVVERLHLDRAEVDSALAAIVREAARTLGSSAAALTVLDGERQRLVVRAGIDADETPRAVSFCGHAILDPANPLIVPDASQDPRFAGNPLVTEAGIARFYAGVPLVVDGQPVGALCVLGDRARERPDAQTIDRLRALGKSASDRLDEHLR